MATATAEARERRQARKLGRQLLEGGGGENGNGKHDGNGQAAHAPAGPSAAELRGQLDKVKAQQAELSPVSWQDTEKKRRLDKQARELEPALEAAVLREMPAPPAGEALSRFIERDVPVAAIRITGNHREDHDEVELARLAHLIRSSGGLQQRIGLREAGDGTFELIWGSRRLAATKLNGEQEIPAKVYASSLTPDDVETLRSIDNLGKKDLSHVERAMAVARNIDAVSRTLEPMHREAKRRNFIIIDEDVLAALVKTPDAAIADGAILQSQINAAGGLHAYVGRRLGRDERWVKENSYVADLGGEARQLLAAGRITVGHARELAKLKDKSRTDGIAQTVARNENGLGGMSVADTRRMVIEAMCDLSRVPWDLHQAFGKDERKGCHGYACSACPFNSTADPDLFEGVVALTPERGVCTNPACFEVKEKIAAAKLEQAVTAARKEKKEHKVELTIRGLGAVISKFRELKPESLVRRVKKELEPAPKKPAASRSSMYGRQLTPAEKAEADAKQKFENARRQWANAAAKKLNDALDAVPGRATLFGLLKDVDFWRSFYDYDYDRGGTRKKGAAIAAKQRTKDLVALLKTPSMDAVHILEKASGGQEGIDAYRFQYFIPEARDLIAGVLDVKLDDAPDLNTFLQEAKAKLAEKPAPADAKGKAKGKSKGAAGDEHAAAAEHHTKLKAKKKSKKPAVLPPISGDDEDDGADDLGEDDDG